MFTLGDIAISWGSIKQSCVIDSTMEVEYVATSKTAKEAIWLKNFVLDLGEVPLVQSPITLYGDNSRVVANLKKPSTQKR